MRLPGTCCWFDPLFQPQLDKQTPGIWEWVMAYKEGDGVSVFGDLHVISSFPKKRVDILSHNISALFMHPRYASLIR